ncbi:MAG TPA: hypothetical protein PKZ16_01925 [bacterium]|nr:hypothetical protein [bacterium]HPL95786.1 hypothetical protein [bacterium]
MNKKVYIILIILLLLAMILVGFFWFLIKSQNEKQPPVVVVPEQEEAQIAPETEVTEEPEVIIPEASSEQKEKAQLGQLASAFSERLGSYSNQSNYENLVDLKAFMSEDLQKWADNQITNGRVNVGSSGPYFGLTTKALKTELISYDSEQALFMVSTQRHEVVGVDFNDRVYYQNIELEMIKVDGVWVVNRFTWK